MTLPLSVDALTTPSQTQAWQALDKLGLPHRRQENWKYTDLANIYQTMGIKQICQTWQAANIDLGQLPNGYYHCVFVDGNYVHSDMPDEHVSIQKGVAFELAQAPDAAMAYLTKAASIQPMMVTVEQPVTDQPILITHYVTDQADAQLVSSYVQWQIQADCHIQQQIISNTNALTSLNVYHRLNIAQGVHCHFDAIASQQQSKVIATQTWHVDVERDASFNAFHVAGAVALSRNDIQVVLRGTGAQCRLYGAMLTTQKHHVDYHLYVYHQASHTMSDVDFKGLADQKSRCVFNAQAIVDAGLKGIGAYQNNRNIQLSQQAQINTKPELQIYSDDVACTHGATVGQLDLQALFYLQSRGITQQTAKSLLMQGFVKAILGKLDTWPEPLQNTYHHRMDQIIDTLI